MEIIISTIYLIILIRYSVEIIFTGNIKIMKIDILLKMYNIYVNMTISYDDK